MKLAIVLVGVALIAFTALSRVHSARWWIRFADFPRSQVAVLLACVLGLHLATLEGFSPFEIVFTLLLIGCLIYQCARILPYTPLAPRQVLGAGPGDPGRHVRLLISNVLMENRNADAFLALVRDTDPDVILAVETDGWWDERLSVLERDYPFVVRQPQDNFFGMHMFSRLRLSQPALRFLVEEEIPSIRTTITLRSGDEIEFFGLHPRPPEPAQDTEERDAELLLVGKEVKRCDRPAIVAGDLNDVAWSNTTRLFQRISGLLDPRRGRGLFSTFHAAYPVLRWPLDHVFHDQRFTLVKLRRLRSIGSDHFPVLVELRLEPAAAEQQDAPQPDGEDLALAAERIEEARDKVEARTTDQGNAGVTVQTA